MKTKLSLMLVRVAGIVAFGIAASPTRALAQTPGHKHYESSPEAEKPSATGEMAPRLQKLGA